MGKLNHYHRTAFVLCILAFAIGCSHTSVDRQISGVNFPKDCAGKTQALYKVVKMRPAAVAKDAQQGLVKYYFDDATREGHRIVIYSGMIDRKDGV